jgi:hypothetical protein
MGSYDMESIRSILISLLIVSGFFSALMAFCWIYAAGSIDSEIGRANAVIGAVEKEGKQTSLMYWVNVGYVKFITNFGRIFLISIGVMLANILILRLFALF